jgi:pimeloyl-ACP methyl ester carboxylesterase
MESVVHHGRETAYRVVDRGDAGTPLLCIHGSGGDGTLWRGQHALADERPVVALDLSGHGESDDIDAEPGYETLSAYAADAHAVARETGAGVLVGASLGGAVALTLALDYDLDPEALVLAGTGAKLSVLSDLLSWLDDDFERAVDFLHRPDALFYDPDEATVERSKALLKETGRAVTRRDFLTCHRFDVRERLGEIATPSLAVVGEYDRLTPRWYHEYLRDELPDCDLALVEAAAHLTMVERPAAFNEILEAFLAERGV